MYRKTETVSDRMEYEQMVEVAVPGISIRLWVKSENLSGADRADEGIENLVDEAFLQLEKLKRACKKEKK